MRLVVGSAASARTCDRAPRSTAAPSRSDFTRASRFSLGFLDLGADLEDLGGRLVVALEEGVDPDDDVAPVVQLALEVVGRVGDLALEPARLDARERTFEHRAVAQLEEVREHRLGPPFQLVGQRLDVPRPAERVGDVRRRGSRAR